MYHPSRGGVRGGADQFEWESVKADKHRENYLGHSLMAPVGRWQKNKDLQWFSRDKKSSSSSKEAEKEAIRRMEEEAMAAALGKAPVKRAPTQLTKQELEEVCRKGQTERDDKDIERIEGMGFGSTRASLMDSTMTKETMSAMGCEVSKDTNRQADKTDQEDSNSKESKKDRKKDKKEKRKKKKKKSKSIKRFKRHDSTSDSDDGNRKVKMSSHRDRSRRWCSEDDDIQSTKHKSKRRRHDSTTDTVNQSQEIRVRKSDSKAKVSKLRFDSSSDDESHLKKKYLVNSRYEAKRQYSLDNKQTHYRRNEIKETRRERHDSYSD